ncbi:capsular biosynthesis protein [Noviherbaspirillum sp. 1P10PC]|uniref:capsular polysaccharide export protein, LipB/KpsS family n=1 Tax=Noviherbaspirillum sp. 1P10PC TaxID=3132292 RepID=UPI00399FB924
MIVQGLAAFRNKRVLLLQGPVGPFFQRLAADLAAAGAQVFKVNLNGGDWLFYPRGAMAFRGAFDEWPVFLNEVIDTHAIDTVLLFGDCRAYHRIAHQIAKERKLEVGVFEEGYIRPDYITLERDGVNGNSTLPNNPIFYLNKVPSGEVYTEPVGNTFWLAALWACLYYLAAQILWPVFSRYRHHRPLSILETGPWVRSIWRKAFYRIKERDMQSRLTGALSSRFFLVPLQVHNDAQIHSHSRFASVEEFIRHVATSFALHAPAGTVLVVKHHPMDRGYNDYSRLLRRLGRELAIAGRLLYVHDLHLPSLLQHTRGTVLINSTVGLSALFHKSPLKVCGEAIYAIKGLVYQEELDQFWQDAEKTVVNCALLNRFRSYLIEHTQLNGSFYRRLPIPGSHAGIRWEERRRKPRKKQVGSARQQGKSAAKPTARAKEVTGGADLPHSAGVTQEEAGVSRKQRQQGASL